MPLGSYIGAHIEAETKCMSVSALLFPFMFSYLTLTVRHSSFCSCWFLLSPNRCLFTCCRFLTARALGGGPTMHRIQEPPPLLAKRVQGLTAAGETAKMQNCDMEIRPALESQGDKCQDSVASEPACTDLNPSLTRSFGLRG